MSERTRVRVGGAALAVGAVCLIVAGALLTLTHLKGAI